MIDVGVCLADRYEVRSRLGSGGMGDVWLAWDTSLERLVAVKVLRGVEAEDAARFEAESRAQATLTHPSVVPLYATGTHDDAQFLVMSYVDGRPLSDMLRDGPLPAAQVASIGRQIAGALAHAHARGVIHRDIKPGNVLVDEAGAAFLTDFGIARLDGSAQLTRTGTVMGSASYIAPEQLGDQAVTSGADVYSLGLLLLEALTGEREYTGTAVEAAVARLVRPPRIPDGLAHPWPSLLARMLATDPAQRPGAADVVAVLEHPEGSSDEAATVPITPEEPSATLLLPQPGRAATADGQPADEPGRDRPWLPRIAVVAAGVAVLVLGMVAQPRAAQDRPEPAEVAVPTTLDEALDRLEEAIEP